MPPGAAARARPTFRPVALSTPKIVLLVFTAIVLVCACAVGVSQALQRSETATTTVRRAVDRIVIAADAGDIRLQGTAARAVRLRRHSRWLWRKPHVHATLRGRTLEVRGDCPTVAAFGRCAADLTVGVPAGVDVTVRAGAADITATRLSGALDLRTGAGDVRGDGLRPVTVAAASDAGAVDLGLRTTPVRVDASSDAGDVTVTVPAGSEYRVDASTAAGRVDVGGVLRNDHALRRILARTAAGDVRVRGRG
jgi:DUF4097 and DUF4098 domain-containing protein YvlB